MREPSSRRSEILDIAATIFVRKGFEGAKVREIAEAAGVLPGSLYHHFKSKEQMLHEVMRPFMLRTIDLYREIVRRGDRPAVTLRNLVRAGLMISLEEPATHSILLHQWEFIGGNREFDYVVRIWEETHKLWSGVVRAGVEAREFRDGLDAGLTTHLILEQISSTVFWSQIRRGSTTDEVVSVHVDLLMNGVLDSESS